MKAITPFGWGILFVLLTAFFPSNPGFEESQKAFPRVRDAYERKEELFAMKCRTRDIPETFSNMFIRVFKEEGILELWALDVNSRYVLFGEYKVYAMSGTLGPKRQEGDTQVPEGFYYIKEFNPVSNYHLSLGINYPNQSDLILSAAPRKGGNIFIHGGHASAGCVAMSNYYIEDIYMAAVKAQTQGQSKIPVHIFPFKMIPINIENHSGFAERRGLTAFWKNLTDGYRFFEHNKTVPEVSVASNGTYLFSQPSTASK
ncbi:MAG: L,D-transpeptidase family protein [Chitinophagales bacterium]|nr:L,D-transpeptidase family protein [Chitinophagales bacterium]